MKAPAIPFNEEERLKALLAYNVLDTLPEPEYDDITRIASQICNTPIALISLIDKDRQWFKSKKGLEAAQTPREFSFCGHAINSPGKLFEVKDSTKDERFKDNPLVISAPEVIYYLGSPLVTPTGVAIGTLCVIDHKPHEVSEEAKATLQLLSRQVVCQLELRKQNAELTQVNDQLNIEIRNRIKTQEKLVIARDKAIEADQTKDRFLSNISHEIRTPLNGVIGITKLLLADQALLQAHKELIQDLDFSANHLLRIINDILDLTKIRQDKLLFEQKEFNFEEFLNNICRLLAVSAKSKGIEFTIDHDRNIDPLVNGDANRLGQILLNIAGNAIKFTSEGSVGIRTKLIARSAGVLQIQFEITDTGIGIPKDQLNHILDPFTQSDSSISRRFGGTGLGLAIAINLIRQFGGQLEIESKVGLGSNFRFSIQLTYVQDQDTAGPAKECTPLPTPAGSSRPLHILLAEDNVMNQKVAEKHLKNFGFSTHIVSNGQDAIAALEKYRFDLVLMDIQMPIMDGLEATRKIRNSNQDYRDIHIIVWTASVLSEETKRLLKEGANDVVSKPFDPKVLHRKILNLTKGPKD